MMSNKDCIIKYKNENPDASIREIQRALGVSSPSVVHFHIKSPQKHTKADLLAIVATLKKENEELREKLSVEETMHCIAGAVTDLGDEVVTKLKSEIATLRSRLSAYEEGIRPEDADKSEEYLVQSDFYRQEFDVVFWHPVKLKWGYYSKENVFNTSSANRFYPYSHFTPPSHKRKKIDDEYPPAS